MKRAERIKYKGERTIVQEGTSKVLDGKVLNYVSDADTIWEQME